MHQGTTIKGNSLIVKGVVALGTVPSHAGKVRFFCSIALIYTVHIIAYKQMSDVKTRSCSRCWILQGDFCGNMLIRPLKL